ncbi:hypothetical protein ABT47_08830 [Shewanella xiamenensis]|nr:hypothetical protein ABT47_08830 [Shewanella xiamenensis]
MTEVFIYASNNTIIFLFSPLKHLQYYCRRDLFFDLDHMFKFKIKHKQQVRIRDTLLYSAEESPDDLQINHQIRVEAHLVA